jgi:hypothetical protein
MKIGGVTLLSMISKRKEEKDRKHEDSGSSPKGRYPFPLISKGERNIRREILRALVTGGI